MASQMGLVCGLARQDIVDTVFVSTYYPDHFKDIADIVTVAPSSLRGYTISAAERALLRRKAPVFWGGGVDLQDSGSTAKLALLLVRLWLLKRYGSHLVLACQGAGPVRSGIGKALTRKILSLVDCSVVRERRAGSFLENVARVSPRHVIQAADAALLLPAPNPDFGTKYLTEKGLDVSAPIIGVNLRRWFHQKGGWLPTEVRRRRKKAELSGRMKCLVENLAKSLNKLAESGIHQVALVPMYRAQPEYWEDDIFLLDSVRALLSPRIRCAMVDADLTPHELLSIFSGFEFVIGVRLHSTILAHVAGTPAVHIFYEDKGPEHFRQVGSDKFLISIDSASGPAGDAEIDQCITLLRGGIDAARSRLRDRVAKLRSETEAALRKSLVERPRAGGSE
ncbi:MAG: hypothetical protein GY791_00455 [Alphaproteobacteria bacterium]|nr:hypothetical protein [Alphaproteobacteria bacterium]